MSSHEKFTLRRFFKEHIEIIALVFCVAVAFRLFVFSAYRIPNESMSPTLLPGDFIFGFRLPYGVRVPVLGTKIATDHMPDRGDLVAFQIRDEALEITLFLKRVIGLPGDRVEIREGNVYLNGNSLPYDEVTGSAESQKWETIEGTRHQIVFHNGNQEPVVIPPNSVYVLSDNRARSDDSRQFGPVQVGQIEARAFLVWLSLDWNDTNLPSVRWGRVLKKID